MTWAPKWMWDWPSIAVEAVSGVICVAGMIVAAKLCAYWWGLLIVATVASLLYEKYADDNGFDWKDIGQREITIVIAAVLRAILS